MKTEQLNVPSFHRESLKDDRLFIETRDRVLGYCPRSRTALEYDKHQDQAELRHPITVVEFIYHKCSGNEISNSTKTALYLIAKATEAEINGNDDEAERLATERNRLLEATKTAAQVITDSKIEKALEDYDRALGIPF